MASEEARNVGVEEVKSLWDRDEATLVDVRTSSQYAQSHIPGAVSAPLFQIVRRTLDLPHYRAIVTYCT